MFKKICSLTICSILAISSLLTAVEYDIQDIGTLQTKASEAIAINNRGQILGWYNIDGSIEGKHFFVRDRDGSFHEIAEDFSLVIENIPNPSLHEYVRNGIIRIDWRYLTDDGRVYGVLVPDLFNSISVLFTWDQHNGVVKLGDLPGKEIAAINNAGQVLIKSITENENGRQIRRPVIWENGQITKLRGLEGEIGIESEESYGLDMNNKGVVVGHSVAYLSYKNDIYKQVHAVKWSANGEIIDLHNQVPKSTSSKATAINDLGDVVAGDYLIRADGKSIKWHYFYKVISSNKNYFIFNENPYYLIDRDGNETNPRSFVNAQVNNDNNSIWMQLQIVYGVNDNGEIIASGSTIYGEQHAMLITPIKSN